MRRYFALMSVVTALAAGLGCQHVGGKCDCGYNPSDYPIPAPTNPHPAAPPAPLGAKPLPPGAVAPGVDVPKAPGNG